MPSSLRMRLSSARTERPLAGSAWIRVFTLRVELRVKDWDERGKRLTCREGRRRCRHKEVMSIRLVCRA
jgi:hypothetical protein